MKKYIVWCILTVLLLGACSADAVNHPGQVLVFGETDPALIPGYTPLTDTDNPNLLSILRPGISDEKDVPPVLSVNYDGNTYESRYLMTYKPFLRHYSYDVYVFRLGEEEKPVYEYHRDRRTGAMIGFRVTGMVSDTIATMTDEEIVRKAKQSLAEYVNEAYYKCSRIVRGNGNNTVFFYNEVQGIELADSSFVEMSDAGEILAVEAFPEPELLKKAENMGFDLRECDNAAEHRVIEAFPEIQEDTSEQSMAVALNGVKIHSRTIALDDAGELILVYYLTPELSYRVIYKGKAAEIAAERGLPTEQEGISEPPVYAAVYLQP